MNNNFFRIQNAFDSAKTYAIKAKKNCENSASNYLDNNNLYVKTTAKTIVFIVLKFVISCILLFLGISLPTLKYEKLAQLQIDFIRAFLFGISAVLLAVCVFSIFKAIYSGIVKKKARGIEQYSPDIQKGIDKMTAHSVRINVAIENGEDIVFEQDTDIEAELVKFQKETNEVHKKSRTLKQIILTALFGILTIFSFIFLSKSIATNMAAITQVGAKYIPIVSYIALFLVMMFSVQNLTVYYGKKLKFGLLGLFILFQGSVIFQLIKAGVYSAMTPPKAELSDGANAILTSMIAYILSYQTVTLILSTLMIIMLLIMFNADLSNDKYKNGMVIPMSGSSSIKMGPAGIKWAVIWRIVLALIFGVIGSGWMVGVLTQKLTFWRFILYIIIGVLWGLVGFLLSSDKFKAICGRLTTWLKISMFSVFALLTLASLPSFHVWTLILLALQYVVIYAVALVLAFL